MKFFKLSLAIFFVLILLNAYFYIYLIKTTDEVRLEAERLGEVITNNEGIDITDELIILDENLSKYRNSWEMIISHSDTEEAAKTLKKMVGLSEIGNNKAIAGELTLFIFYVDNIVQKVKPDVISVF